MRKSCGLDRKPSKFIGISRENGAESEEINKSGFLCRKAVPVLESLAARDDVIPSLDTFLGLMNAYTRPHYKKSSQNSIWGSLRAQTSYNLTVLGGCTVNYLINESAICETYIFNNNTKKIFHWNLIGYFGYSYKFHHLSNGGVDLRFSRII